jgi:hypothetical protein
MKQVVVKVKGHPCPKFTMGKLKVEYVQISYDNRYVTVKQNDWGTNQAEIVKVADKHLARILVNALVNDAKDHKDLVKFNKKLDKFFEDIKIYDEILDSDES